MMNVTHRIVRWIRDRFAPRHETKPEVRLKISNITRQTELACCAELADRGEKRRKGLLGRDLLSPGEGLWIIPCEAVHTVGMRFSIDLVYLDRSMRVTKVKRNVPPWRLSACLSAHSVLELASGTIQKTETRRGDILKFSAVPLANHSRLDACSPTLR